MEHESKNGIYTMHPTRNLCLMSFALALLVGLCPLLWGDELTTKAAKAAAKSPPAPASWVPKFLCAWSPYCCKSEPCPPCYAYCGFGDTYCRKPMPCLTPKCQRWCPDRYCRKPDVCDFPWNPCEHCEACR